MTYASVQRWAEAGSYYDKCYELAKEIGDIRLQATLKLNRVNLYLAINDLTYAKAFCQHALRVFAKLEDHLGEADAYKYMGMIYTKKGNWQAAEDYFTQSIAITKEYQHPLGEAEAHVEFGRMFKAKKEVESARMQLQLAQSIYQTLELKKEIAEVEKDLADL